MPPDPSSRTGKVYEALRLRIEERDLAPGAKLPAHLQLAREFGVSPMTMRTVLAGLEEEGWVSRRHGSGTYVRERSTPAVLLVGGDALEEGAHRALTEAGYRMERATTAEKGLSLLERDYGIRLLLSDVRLPDVAAGVGFICTVRRRHPGISVAALIDDTSDLAALYATPDFPVLVLPKPVHAQQAGEVLQLIREKSTPPEAYQDVATGLPNRTLFRDRLTSALSAGRRHGQVVGLVLLRLGAGAGDLLAASESEVATALLSTVRDSDTVGRLSAGEFACVFPNVGSRDNMVAVQQKVVMAIDEITTAQTHMDAGMALYPFDGATTGALLQHAAAALRPVLPARVRVTGSRVNAVPELITQP